MGLFSAFFEQKVTPDRQPAGRHAAPASSTASANEAVTPNSVHGRHAAGAPRSDFDGFLRLSSDADGVVVDTETVGLGRDIEVFEFGALLLRGGDIIHRYNQLIRPSRPLDAVNMSLSAVSDRDLSDAPPIGFVLPQIIDAIASLTVIGHNVSYDLTALNIEAARYGVPPLHPDTVDTLDMARALFPNAPRHTLQDVMRMLGIDRPERHRALADAEDTFEVWSLMTRMDGPRYFDMAEVEVHRATSDKEKARKDRLFSKAAYLNGRDCTPVNEQPEGTVIDHAEGVEILGDEDHQPILAKYGYDAWLWVQVHEGIIEKGSNYGYPTYWVTLDGERIGYLSKKSMQRYAGLVPPDGAVAQGHIKNCGTDRAKGVFNLRLQMPTAHEPVELERKAEPPKPIKKPAVRREPKHDASAVAKPKPASAARASEALFVNAKPHKKVLPTHGKTVELVLDDGALAAVGDVADGARLWLVVRPSGSAGMSVRFGGRLLGVVDDVDGLEFVSDDGNVAAGTIRRDGCAVRVLVEV